MLVVVVLAVVRGSVVVASVFCVGCGGSSGYTRSQLW